MNDSQTILIVNKNQKNIELPEEFLIKHGFNTKSATEIEDIEKAELGCGCINLALVDITGFNSAIWEKLKELQKSGIPFIVISPKQVRDIRLEAESMKAGARAVLLKPLTPNYLIGLVKELLS